MFCCLLAFVGAGVLVERAHRLPPRSELDTEGAAILILSGCVVEPSALSPDRDQFTLELEPGAHVRVSLYVREGESPPILNYGQRVELGARVRPTHNFNNPGSFDYAHYLAPQGVYWTSPARAAAPIRILPGHCGSIFRSVIFRLRAGALEERLYSGSLYKTGMMQAILIGETAAHVAVLAAFVYGILLLLFLPRGAANLATVVAIWVYALV
jgi:predicted membrane metal-binding protein